MTTFADGVFQYGGMPVGQLMIPPGGKWYWVDAANGSDSNDGSSPAAAMKTIGAAYAKTVTGKNDVVALIQSTAGTQELTAIAWSNNLTHLVGMASPVHAGQRARITCAAADTATNDMSPFITISGYGCIFANLYIWQGQADASTLINVSVSGDRNYFQNVHFAGGGNATQAVDGGCSLQIDGAEECMFKHCTFGVDTVGASTGYATVSFTADGAAARNVFEDCIFTLHASGGTPAGAIFVELLNTTAIDRYQLFRRCTFINLATTALASAFVLPAGWDPDNKRVLLENCSLIGATDWDANNRGILYLNNGTITGGGNAGLFAVSNAT